MIFYVFMKIKFQRMDEKNRNSFIKPNSLFYWPWHVFLCFSGLLFVFLRQLFTWILFESAMKLMWFTILWHFCWHTFPLNMPLKWFCLTSLKSNTSFLAVPYPPGGWASMESRSTINPYSQALLPINFLYMVLMKRIILLNHVTSLKRFH